jgi:hypothetical protein
VEVEVTFSVDLGLRETLEFLSQPPEWAVKAGSESMFQYLIDYHGKMDWRGSRWMPGERSGDFAKSVVAGWQKPMVSGKQSVIRNTFGLLAWKITGGTISPKRAKFLTIPLVPQAKGLSVGQYVDLTHERVFRAGNAICRRIGKQLEALYALKESVSQGPWPAAMPSDETLGTVAVDGINSALSEVLKHQGGE